MMELLVVGCTGVVVFLHGINFLFRALFAHPVLHYLSFLGGVSW